MTIPNSIPFPIPEQHSPYVLYRFYDADGVLLYVGITNRLRRRCTEHSYKAWFAEASRIEVVGFRSQEVAAAMEALVIGEHSPKYNRAGRIAGVGSSPGRKAVGAKKISLFVPLPLHEWLRAEADLHRVEVTEMILRCVERAWEMEGVTPRLEQYNPSDGPIGLAHRRP